MFTGFLTFTVDKAYVRMLICNQRKTFPLKLPQKEDDFMRIFEHKNRPQRAYARTNGNNTRA